MNLKKLKKCQWKKVRTFLLTNSKILLNLKTLKKCQCQWKKVKIYRNNNYKTKQSSYNKRLKIKNRLKVKIKMA